MKKKGKLRFSKMMKKGKKGEVLKKKPKKEEKVLQEDIPEKQVVSETIPKKEISHLTPSTTKKIDKSISEEEKQENLEYMMFKVDNEFYGISIDYVKEIVNKIDLVKAPNLPAFVIGLLEMRERMVPVINLRKKFKIGKGAEGNSIIITSIRNEVVGFLVDKVVEIIRVNKQDVMDVPFIFDERERLYIAGIIEFNNDLISILRVENILEEEELTKIEKLSKE